VSDDSNVSAMTRYRAARFEPRNGSPSVLSEATVSRFTAVIVKLDTVGHVPERLITFDNVFNFRDLGGYRGDGGRTVRWGRLFRADDLCRFESGDLARLRELGVRTVIDLRRPVEIKNIGRIPEGGFTYVNAYLRHPEWPALMDFDSPQARIDFLVERYLEMAEQGGEAIGDALRLVADPDAGPLVFHCVSGKDRTGLVAAFTLHLLGVSDDDIADDYALSEEAEEPNFAWYSARDPAFTTNRRWERYTVTPREVVPALFAVLRERHGSLRAYLHSIGVTDEHAEAMRAHLLR
jgi:protein-tyrosine phosphatase